MVKEKIVYEVNGKLFDNREDAIKEEQRDRTNQKRVVNNIYEILHLVTSLSNTIENKDLYSLEITVNNRELCPEWYVKKPYHSVFVMLLKKLNVKYSASEGDERRSSYFKVYPSKISDLPSVDELVNYIDETLAILEQNEKERLNKILGRYL